MSLQNSIKEHLQEQFTNAKLLGTADKAIRNGYYYIKDVYYQNFKTRKNVPLAKVHWKGFGNSAFVKDVEFQVSLSPLGLESFLDYMNLINKVVIVTNTRLAIGERDGIKVTSIVCDHCIDDATPAFETLMGMVLSTFMGNANSVSEAYNSFQANLGVDLTGALEAEATPDDVYDEPDEDTSDENTDIV